MTTDRGRDGPPSSVAVWDGAVRAVHWSFAALVPLMWWTAEQGAMDWHRRLGLTLLGLVIFRLYWGFAGTPTARFSHFVKGPRTIVRYVSVLKPPYAPARGHNPLGALSVLALLAALFLQLSAGLFAIDIDGLEEGPLAHLVSFDQARAAAGFHETFFNILVGLIALHIAAIAFYWAALRTNLIGAMITGRRAVAVPASTPDAEDDEITLPALRFAIGVVIAIAVVFLIQR